LVTTSLYLILSLSLSLF